MKPALVALSFCAFAAAASCLSVPTAAQQRDRCADYANQMIAQDQRARQMKCPNWTSHSNYGSHYSWCQARPPQAAEAQLANWQTRFQTCEFAAGGSTAAKATLNECESFATFSVAANARYAQAACPPRVYMHSNKNGHYNWCITRTTQVITAERNNKQRALNACLSGGVIP